MIIPNNNNISHTYYYYDYDSDHLAFIMWWVVYLFICAYYHYYCCFIMMGLFVFLIWLITIMTFSNFIMMGLPQRVALGFIGFCFQGGSEGSWLAF